MTAAADNFQRIRRAHLQSLSVHRGMLTGMRNIELHVLENNADVGDGITAGLLEIEEVDGAECSTCAESVGHVSGTFYPYAIALDDKSQWNVCTDCAGPVIESSPIQEGMFLYPNSTAPNADE